MKLVHQIIQSTATEMAMVSEGFLIIAVAYTVCVYLHRWITNNGVVEPEAPVAPVAIWLLPVPLEPTARDLEYVEYMRKCHHEIATSWNFEGTGDTTLSLATPAATEPVFFDPAEPIAIKSIP